MSTLTLPTMPAAWPHQEYGVDETWRLIQAKKRRICLTSPTGGGKSRMAIELILRALAEGWGVSLYSNRRMLIEQLSGVLGGAGIDHGIRMAGYEDEWRKRVQVASVQTEWQAVYKRKRRPLHDSGLVLIDEAHIQKGDAATQIINDHVEAGAAVVGITATPLDLGGIYTTLVQAGRTSELRKCGALVPCYHYGPDEPDTKKLKRQASGEYSEGDVKKVIMTATIFARVQAEFGRLNTERRPTILFAPGVGESIWFAQQFHDAGISAAHIDGSEVWVDGEFYPSSREARENVVEASKRGEITVLCNRFVLREGIDLPWLSHGIFATVFGSLQSYLQSGGRLIRAHPSIDRVTLQDHGGNWHRHGSLNADRVWRLDDTAHVVSGMREERLRNKQEPEPIRCPKCAAIRANGPKCPVCGFECGRKIRPVVQKDGSLKEYAGDIYKPRLVRMKSDTLKNWESTYHRAKRSRNGMTFNQAEALFFHEHHYWPPRDLPFMPTNSRDWFRKVRDVPVQNLTNESYK